MIRLAVLSAAAMLLAGCSNLLHSDAQPTQIYILRATAVAHATDSSGSGAEEALNRRAAGSEPADATGAADGSAAAPSLQIPRPSADPGLATQLITLVRSDHRMDYYLGSRWAADLPDLVETLAIDTLRSSGAWGAVHESPSPFLADYLLQINIRRFEADYTNGKSAPRVYVVLDCTVAKRIGRDLVASFVAEGEADAAENRLSSVVTAFEQAANAALTTMADRSAAVAKSAPPVASAQDK